MNKIDENKRNWIDKRDRKKKSDDNNENFIDTALITL